ncbi:MAG: AGE family epimerase/isomerase [Sphaerochaeta sp.]|nr:AGE family epimerase/isomerase [Sphaerochaeta sp.]MDD4301360.1 AGE family epimerase/isomerase [Sphaerochaeta sp.]MDD4648134.1 AGE family epimerase/isomerase [Sphaerochaeta sp.]MDY0243717.1 AGE family epimerase/isomerase [Sphaerochaeta sp.]
MNETLGVQAKRHLTQVIIPFWLRMKDEEYGGFYGNVGFDLTCYKKATKGVVQTCRILYFFSEASLLLHDEACRNAADHAYQFLLSHAFDANYGGLYWSLSHDGEREDAVKSSFCFAHGILALTSYYRLTGKTEALEKAIQLRQMIENHFTDTVGYHEVLREDFSKMGSGDGRFSKGSYGGTKTMNTLLHLLEAYQNLYLVHEDASLLEKIDVISSLFINTVYDNDEKTLIIYFDDAMKRASSYRSYGHEIEASWMLSNLASRIPHCRHRKELVELSDTLSQEVLARAFQNNSVMDETHSREAREKRAHWVQAEAILGFISAYQRNPGQSAYLEAAHSVWNFVMRHLVDKREHSEWLYMVDSQGNITDQRALVWSWKGPYNNGRMCMELIKRCTL